MMRRSQTLLLAAALAAALILSLGSDPQAEAVPDSPAAQLAYKLDRILDALPQQQLEINQRTINEWTTEILPYFEYEGVIGFAIPPDSVRLTAYTEAMEHNHVLGRAYCTPAGGGPIEINARVGNEVSAWYGRTTFLATLVHELGHVQGGGLCSENSAETESTTQLVTLEVLAAMANGGNNAALIAGLFELRDMMMGAVHYEATLGKVEGWQEFRTTIYSTPAEIARAEKSKRRWRSDPATLKEILFKYSWIPAQKILKGLPAQKIPGLHLGEPPWDGSLVEYGEPIKPRALVIDDLAYLVTHAAELAEPVAGGIVGPNRPKSPTRLLAR